VCAVCCYSVNQTSVRWSGGGKFLEAHAVADFSPTVHTPVTGPSPILVRLNASTCTSAVFPNLSGGT
jgi:hypothetical protein